MKKSVAILQSNYIPWKGYFDIIKRVDEFIIYDDVQYTKNDWRNRNKIKTSNGIKWLTIPVRHIHLNQKINETIIADKNWGLKHWKTIEQEYSQASFFYDYAALFHELFTSYSDELLSNINITFIKAINEILGIDTKISLSSMFQIKGDKNERLVELCKQVDASEYISGPAAKSYLREDLFIKDQIEVTWVNYNNYPEYPQLHPPFDHFVSIIDLIFNVGVQAPKFMISK